MKYLVDNGANVNVKDDEALRWSSVYGYKEVMALLRAKSGPEA